MASKLINITTNEKPKGKSMRKNRENLLFVIDCWTRPEGETTFLGGQICKVSARCCPGGKSMFTACLRFPSSHPERLK